MKKYIIWVTIISLLSITCIFFLNHSKENESESEKIYASSLETLDYFYRENSDFTGFNNHIQPDIFETYWNVGILSLIESPIQNIDTIKIWLQNNDLNEFLQLEPEHAEASLIKFVELNQLLNIEIDKSKVKKIEEFITESKSVTIDDIEVYPNKLILTSTLNDNRVEDELQKKKFEEISSKNPKNIYYKYLSLLAGNNITEEEFQGFLYSEDKTLDAKKVNRLFYLKLISEINNYEFKETLDETQLRDFVNFTLENGSNFDSQFIYKLLYVFNDSLSDETRKQLTEFINERSIYNGWVNNSISVDLVSTKYGLIITRYDNKENRYNIENIHLYLKNVLSQIQNNWDGLAFYLPTFTESWVQIIQNNDDYIKFLDQKLNDELTKDKINIDLIIPILDSFRILNHELTDRQRLNILNYKNDIFDYLNRDNKELDLDLNFIYYSTLLHKALDKNYISKEYDVFVNDYINQNYQNEINIDINNLKLIISYYHLTNRTNELELSKLVPVLEEKAAIFEEKKDLLKWGKHIEVLQLLNNL